MSESPIDLGPVDVKIVAREGEVISVMVEGVEWAGKIMAGSLSVAFANPDDYTPTTVTMTVAAVVEVEGDATLKVTEKK